MSLPKDIFETHLAERTRDASAQQNINAVYRFDISGDQGGSWIVDFRQDSPGVRQSDEEGQCTISMTDQDFLSMLAGKLNAKMAFMLGKLKVAGDMGLALKLGEVLRPQ